MSKFHCASSVSALLVCFCLTAFAGEPKPAPQESSAPYWTAESGWYTEFQLKNNLEKSDLTVTPVLRMKDGTELPLDAVTIPSNSVVSVALNDQLAKHSPALQNQPGSCRSVAFRYTSKSARNLYVAVMVHMHGQPIGYPVDAFPVYSQPMTGSREGIWWRPSENSKDFLVLSNNSGRQISGALSLFDAAG